jgi:hypothetical protein
MCACVCLLQHPALKPEVEAALKQLLASPEVKAQFHDPAVHAALQEVGHTAETRPQERRNRHRT